MYIAFFFIHSAFEKQNRDLPVHEIVNRSSIHDLQAGLRAAVQQARILKR